MRPSRERVGSWLLTSSSVGLVFNEVPRVCAHKCRSSLGRVCKCVGSSLGLWVGRAEAGPVWEQAWVQLLCCSHLTAQGRQVQVMSTSFTIGDRLKDSCGPTRAWILNSGDRTWGRDREMACPGVLPMR